MVAPALLALLPVGWDSCRLPTFDWLLLDSGAGSSMSYAMTDMGAHLYFGGHTAGNLSIIGANGVEQIFELDLADDELESLQGSGNFYKSQLSELLGY